ncbi:hypothetical protein SMICM304S_05842 [Streptomyces microflavus]
MRDLVTVYNALVSQDVPLLDRRLPSDITLGGGAAGRGRCALPGRRRTTGAGVLAQETEPLELPTDFPRPQLQSYAGDTLFLELGRDEVRRIAEAAASARGVERGLPGDGLQCVPLPAERAAGVLRRDAGDAA